MMESAFLLVNSNCYNHCKYCFYNTNSYMREDASFEIENIPFLISFLNKNKVKDLMITGGDCLHKTYFSNTCQIIKEVRKKTLTKVHILSSSVNLNKSQIKRLKDSGLNSVYISIDSVNKSINDFIRGNTTSTLKSIDLYKKNKIELRATVVVTPLSIKDLEKTYLFLKKTGFTEINIQPAFLPYKYKDICRLDIRKSDNKEKEYFFNILNKLICKQKKTKYAELLNAVYIKKKKIRSIDCFMGKKKCVIKNNGNIFVCFQRQEKIGSIFESSELKEIKNPCNLFSLACISLFSEKYYNQKT